MVSSRPIKRLTVTHDDSGLLLDPREAGAALASLSPATIADPDDAAPYMTAYLDWRPAGSDPGRRPARRQFEDAANELLAHYPARTPAAESLAIDIERITKYLDGERVDRSIDVPPLPSATQGIVIVARAQAGVFEPIVLGVPAETNVTAAPIPALAELIRIGEDYEPYAVLVADKQEANLTFVAQGRAQREVNVRGAGYPFRRKAGGNQRRYQARAGERLDQFARTLAEGVRRELDEWGVHVLIVAGDEVITSPLMSAFPASVSDRVVGLMRKDIRAATQDVIDKTLPVAWEAEREREAGMVDRIAQTIGAGGPAVAGPDAVLRALKDRRVEEIAMVDDFAIDGWSDYAARVAGVGAIPDRHPTGGRESDMVPVPIQEELIRLAMIGGAEVEIVQIAAAGEASLANQGVNPRSEMAQQLDQLGGVAATLRY